MTRRFLTRCSNMSLNLCRLPPDGAAAREACDAWICSFACCRSGIWQSFPVSLQAGLEGKCTAVASAEFFISYPHSVVTVWLVSAAVSYQLRLLLFFTDLLQHPLHKFCVVGRGL